MKRRDFLALACTTVAAWPLAGARAQSVRMKRIAILSSLPERDAGMPRNLAAMRAGLMAQGWVEGQNLRIDSWFDNSGTAAAAASARAAVSLGVDVIMATGPFPAVEAKRATSTIPIVSMLSDPIGIGVVANAARPEANVTGFTLNPAAAGGEMVEYLKEASPTLKQIGWLVDASTTISGRPAMVVAAEAAAAAMKIDFTVLPVGRVADLPTAIAQWASQPDRGLIVVGSLWLANRRTIAEEVARHRLPAVFGGLAFAEEGVVLAHGADPLDVLRRGAEYAGLILNGAKVADLPVQDPVKFTLIINMKSAKAQGMTIPITLFARADQVIE